MNIKELKVLIAEDSILNLKIAQIVMSRLKIDFSIANNGKEALEMAKQHKYDLIFMDLLMPEMDGLEAAKKIREHYSDSDCKPVIVAMTAGTSDSDWDFCQKAGMNDFIEKPPTIQRISEVLKKYFMIDIVD